MDAQTCHALVRELLPSIPIYARLTATRAGGAKLRVAVGEREADGGALDVLHIQCKTAREVAEEGAGGKGGGAGAAPSSTRGYFETPPPSITVLYDDGGFRGSGEEAGGEASLFSPPPSAHSALLTLLTHEGVHAYDALIHGLDLSQCGQLACSEVRAASAAECGGVWPPWAKTRCVERLAGLSTALVCPAVGRQCVTAVLSACELTGGGGGEEDNPLATTHAFRKLLDAEAAAVAQAAGRAGMT